MVDAMYLSQFAVPGEGIDWAAVAEFEGDEIAASDAGYTYCSSGRCGECDACIDEGNRLYELEVMP